MNKLLTIAIAVVVAGAAGFYGGMIYGKSSGTPAGVAQGNLRNSQQAGMYYGMGRGNGQSGNLVNGQILSKDDKSITVKMNDGSSKIVFVSGSTRVTKSAEGSLSDLAAGENVTVNGTANGDGSVTAQSVQLRPASPVSNQQQ